MTEPLYSIGTYDMETQSFSPQDGVPAFNLTLWQLKESMRMLRAWGYSCHRWRDEDGGHRESDPSVYVERTDGRSEAEILQGWK